MAIKSLSENGPALYYKHLNNLIIQLYLKALVMCLNDKVLFDACSFYRRAHIYSERPATAFG